MPTTQSDNPIVECSDECSMVSDEGGWSGLESECATKQIWYYGQRITIPCCPRCGEEVRDPDAGYGPDPDAAAERRQMGISAL
jgi:hypothetical protein